MKPYRQVAIVECHEPLVPIPVEVFGLVQPHPYEQLGAPYGDKSPFFLRQGVIDRLTTAQAALQRSHSNWKIQIFDAYRPIAVQQFMVDYAFQALVREKGWQSDRLTDGQRQEIYQQVYEFWAVPSADPATPPPHSTGAAIDLTLVDGLGQPVEMGSPIDELSPRSYPDHFANSSNPDEQRYHQHRQLLYESLAAAGFTRHPQEWWHFSYGDQLWAWLLSQNQPNLSVVARYGTIH
jgi:D-alanyl-D-alanine dipeptidase